MQAILTIISLLGTYLNCKKLKVCFILWIICNIGWAVVDWISGSYSRFILDNVQTVFAIYGWIEWRKLDD